MIKSIKIGGIDHYDSIELSKQVRQTHQNLKGKFSQVGYTELIPDNWHGNGCAIPKPVAIQLLKRYDITKMKNGTKLGLQQMLDYLNGVKPKAVQELIDVKKQLNQMRNELSQAKEGERVDLTGIEEELNQHGNGLIKVEGRLNSFNRELIKLGDGLDCLRSDLIDGNDLIKQEMKSLTNAIQSVQSESKKSEDDLIVEQEAINRNLKDLTGRFELVLNQLVKEKQQAENERNQLAAEAAKLQTWSWRNWRSWSFEGTLNRGGNFIAILFSSFLTVMVAYLIVISIEAKLQADTVLMFGAKIDWSGLFVLMLVVQIAFVVINGNKRFFVVKYRNSEETDATMILASVVFGCYNFSMNIFRFFYQKEVELFSMEFWFYIQISLVLTLAISVLGYVVAKRTKYKEVD